MRISSIFITVLFGLTFVSSASAQDDCSDDGVVLYGQPTEVVNDPGLDILDVTDKSNIVPLAQLLYVDGVYSHQAWLSADRQYLFLDDELQQPTTTRVFDVSDLTDPFLATEFNNGNTARYRSLLVSFTTRYSILCSVNRSRGHSPP